MFSSSLLTVGSLAVQLRTMLTRSPVELLAKSPAPQRSMPDGNRPGKFSLLRGPQTVRTIPQWNTGPRPVSVTVIAPEVLAAISATLTDACGTYVPIRAVKKLAPQSTVVSTWAHQGRALVHASHDLPRIGQPSTRNDADAAATRS